MVLRTWHGPALVVGKEGDTAVYVGCRGQTTKCAPEAVRLASTMEQISAEGWAEAIEYVLSQCVSPTNRGN